MKDELLPLVVTKNRKIQALEEQVRILKRQLERPHVEKIELGDKWFRVTTHIVWEEIDAEEGDSEGDR